MGPFYVDAIPGEPLVLTVKDRVTDTAKALTQYTAAVLLMVGPDGTAITTTANGGSASITDAANGEVTYTWPTASLFSEAGDYKAQLKLTGTNKAEYTSVETFEVLTPIA